MHGPAPDQDISAGAHNKRERSYHTQNSPGSRPRSPGWSVIDFRIHRRLRERLLLFLLQTQSAALHPDIEFRTERVNRAHPVMLVAVNGHPFALLPALDRGYVAA